MVLLTFQLDKSQIKRTLKIQLLQNKKVKYKFSKLETTLIFHCKLYQKFTLQFSKINQLLQLRKMQTIMWLRSTEKLSHQSLMKLINQ